MTQPDTDPDDGRDETRNQRADRNWDELLQELRVTQTGTQILMGFLLTIPFQQRFEDLDAFQRDLYLVLVVLAVVTTALILAPVAIHRALFRRGMKSELVSLGDAFARAGLLVLALVLSGAAMLLFDFVVSRTAGVAMGVASLVVLGAAWWVLPRVIATRAATERTAAGRTAAGR